MYFSIITARDELWESELKFSFQLMNHSPQDKFFVYAQVHIVYKFKYIIIND
jgi:hypothetical protein